MPATPGLPPSTGMGVTMGLRMGVMVGMEVMRFGAVEQKMCTRGGLINHSSGDGRFEFSTILNCLLTTPGLKSILILLTQNPSFLFL